MKNLHLVNNMFDDKSDELFKIRPFVKMCDENFKYVYTCKSPPSVDDVRCNLAMHRSVTPFIIRQPIWRPRLLEKAYKPMHTSH